MFRVGGSNNEQRKLSRPKEIFCFVEKFKENVQQILLDESNKEQNRFPNAEQNNAANFVKISVLTKILFEKISTILFDRQTVSELLKTIFERVSNGKNKNRYIFVTMKKQFVSTLISENELTSSFFDNVNQLLKVRSFIFLFIGSEKVSDSERKANSEKKIEFNRDSNVPNHRHEFQSETKQN